MSIHKKLFIVGWSLVIGSIGLMIADRFLLDCVVIFGNPNLLLYFDQILDLALILTALGIVVLAGTLPFWRRRQGKTFLAITGEMILVIFLLLVLITIGLASLNSARNKGPNTAVKSIVSNLRISAEIYYDKTRSYEGFCSSTEVDNGRTRMLDTRLRVTQGILCPVMDTSQLLVCNDSKDTFAISATLEEKIRTDLDTHTHFCVDSSTFSGTLQNPLLGTKCN